MINFTFEKKISDIPMILPVEMFIIEEETAAPEFVEEINEIVPTFQEETPKQNETEAIEPEIKEIASQESIDPIIQDTNEEVLVDNSADKTNEFIIDEKVKPEIKKPEEETPPPIENDFEIKLKQKPEPKEIPEPKKEIETYAGKELSPSDYEPQDIHTEDYASVLIELSGGARGVFSVSQVSAGRKNRLSFELDGSRCAVAWDQEKPNEMWIGYREKANEILVKDPSLLHEAAKEYAHYPGGHPEAYPDGPKNLFRNVYRAVEKGQMPENPDWSTFVDGHKEMAICDAIIRSNQDQKWTDVEY